MNDDYSTADKLQIAGTSCMSLGCMLTLLIPVFVIVIVLIGAAIGAGSE